ncbi:MAG: endonuclease NucS [Caldilineaceae bacterium]|nr:endonuclease NucS [Caldilineaceae bacterium]
MPIETEIWRIQQDLSPLPLTNIDLEQRLQEIIVADLSIVDTGLMLIGREVPTAFGGYIDILAIDASGNLVVVELKKGRTPREVVAQVLDYASWVISLTSGDIARIFIDYQGSLEVKETQEGIDAALKDRFGAIPDELNTSHRLLIVAAELDPSTERIVSYLQEQYGVDINVAFFRTFRDEDREYLTRTWLIEPDTLATEISSSTAKREWNGEVYVVFVEDESRRWKDAKRYGFVSAGGGDTYVKPLGKLQRGDRVWVHASGNGYVGFGEVLEPAVRPDQFMVYIDGDRKPLTEFQLEAPNAFKEEQGEHFVAVRWIKTVDKQPGIWERGFFSYPRIVARPLSPKWQFTIDRLTSLWGIE